MREKSKMKKAVLFEKLPGKKVKCLACSWYCQISPGQTGVCSTRLNRNGELFSLVYDKVIGPNLDPVEKKPLFHFLPGSTLLSFGTLGCNFGCLFCQNWEESQTIKDEAVEKRENFINQLSANISPKKIVAAAKRMKAAGIAYTYNEPAIFAEFSHDCAKLAKKEGLKNVFVSNGFESQESFAFLKDYLDAINIDLKSFRDDFYLKICKAKLSPVKENIKRYFESGIQTEVTTLVIPGLNDSQKELTDIAKFLYNISPDIPWHISAFSPAYKMLGVPATPYEKLIAAYNIGKKVGLKYVYIGNVTDSKRSSTSCPKCGSLLIFRENYFIAIKNIDLESGKCKNCGEKIYGVWHN